MAPDNALRQMSPQDLMAVGIESLAYVKTVVEGDQVLFEIYAANGVEMGKAANREVAFAALRQQGLEPVSVH